MIKRTLTILGAGTLIVALAAFGAYRYGAASAGAAEEPEQANSGPPPAVVVVAEAEQRTLAPRAETPGSVVSMRDSLVAAETAGKITWVADVGAEVDEGEVIARINPADAELAVSDSAAEVRRLEARSEYLSNLYDRFTGLGEEAGESEAALDEMRANRDEAAQALAQARVAAERARITLQRTEVNAPFAGRIVSQEAQVGEFASPGAGLLRLVDTRRLEVTARAPANLARNLKAGDVIRVASGADEGEATLRAVVPVGDALSRMLELRFELEDADWFIGSPVRIALPAARARSVVAVHRDALVLRADRISVFRIGEDDRAERVDVELGAADGDWIEVIGDIQPGDRLVIRGGERLRDGQTVTLTELRGAGSV